MNSPIRSDDRHGVVLGGTSGIGRAVANAAEVAGGLLKGSVNAPLEAAARQLEVDSGGLL